MKLIVLIAFPIFITISPVKIRTLILSAAALALTAVQTFAQIGDSKWAKDPRIAGIPTTFTNTQATARNQATYPPILLSASTTAPITFLAKAISTGSGPESRFTVTFGSSIDRVNYFTNGTWVFVVATNAAGTAVYNSTNFVPGAKFPYLHILSVSLATNTCTGVQFQVTQPNP